MHSIISIVNSKEFFSPPTLQQLCTTFCASNASYIIFKKCASKNKLKLMKNVILPNEILEDLIANFDKDDESALQMILEICKNVTLQKINLSNCSNLTDEHLRTFMKSFPYTLEIHNCPLLTKQALKIINEYGKNLECLNFGNSTHIIPTEVETWVTKQKEEKPKGMKKLADSLSRFFKGRSENEEDLNKKPGLLRTPNLRKLIIWGHYVHQFQSLREENSIRNLIENEALANGSGDNSADGRISIDFWECLTRDFIEKLEFLDLSGCHELKNLNFLIKSKKTLRFLYLHDVLLDYDDQTWGILRNFSNLKFLDVSQYNELASVFANPDVVLENIVTSLPNLVGLDISGSNLAGFGVEQPSNSGRCTIKGLKSREENRLQFLGLLASHYNASSRDNIPAVRVTGGANMEQLLTALKCYLHRNNMTRKVVRILHERLQDFHIGEFIPCHTIVDMLTQVIKGHIEDKHTLIVSFATLFYALKKLFLNSSWSCYDGITREDRLAKSREDILFHCINRAMCIHFQDMSLLRNGILTINILSQHMKTLDLSHAQALFPTLLKAGKAAVDNSTDSKESFSFFLQSIARLLESLGDKSSIKKVTSVDCIAETCSLINEMFKKNIMDRDMGVYWRLLLKWVGNGLASDPEICKSFADGCGVDAAFLLIKHCCNDVPNERITIDDLLVPVIVLLINVLSSYEPSETRIITSSNMNLVATVMESRHAQYDYDKDLFQYICCGFLATAASKKSSYSLENPSRHEILDKIFEFIKGKPEYGFRSFKFRSLKLLYDLLEVQDAPEIHAWVLWTISSLFESNDPKFIKEIENNKRLNLETLHHRFVRNNLREDIKQEISSLCDRLLLRKEFHTDSTPKL